MTEGCRGGDSAWRRFARRTVMTTLELEGDDGGAGPVTGQKRKWAA
jgi:hypothetical protein